MRSLGFQGRKVLLGRSEVGVNMIIEEDRPFYGTKKKLKRKTFIAFITEYPET